MLIACFSLLEVRENSCPERSSDTSIFLLILNYDKKSGDTSLPGTTKTCAWTGAVRHSTLYIHKAAKGRDLQTGEDKVLPGEAAALFLNSPFWVSLRGGPAMSPGEAQLHTFGLVVEGQVPHGQAAQAGKLPWNPACPTPVPKATRVRSSWKFQIGGGIVFLATFFTKTKPKDGICDQL